MDPQEPTPQSEDGFSIATCTEEFANMVGDLRRTFFGWLKKTENELHHERHRIMDERRNYLEEKARAWDAFLIQKRTEIARINDERRRVENELSLSIKQIALEREEARKRIAEERGHIEHERAMEKRNLAMEEQKLIDQKQAFEAEKKKIINETLASQSTVQLNIGGSLFDTSRSTLMQQSGSLFEGILSGHHSAPKDPQGRLFFDRDGELFRTILQFLRNPQTPPPSRDSIESVALCEEAAYYGLKFFPYALSVRRLQSVLETLSQLTYRLVVYRPFRAPHSASCSPSPLPLRLSVRISERCYFGSASLRGQLYTYGGQNDQYKALCDVEIYDVLRDEWLPAPNLNIPRRNTCGATLGKCLFAIGGFDGMNILKSVEMYDPRMKNWIETHPLNVPRSSACCAVIGDTLHTIGGTSGERLRSVERYEARSDRWVPLSGGLIEVRSAACCSSFLGSIYVFGGIDNSHNIHSSVESLHISTNEWMFQQNLPEPRMDAASTTTSQSIMITGGQNESVLSSSLFYQPEVNLWHQGPQMVSPRYGHQVLVADI